MHHGRSESGKNGALFDAAHHKQEVWWLELTTDLGFAGAALLGLIGILYETKALAWIAQLDKGLAWVALIGGVVGIVLLAAFREAKW
jgi:hypothetical protein